MRRSFAVFILSGEEGEGSFAALRRLRMTTPSASLPPRPGGRRSA